MVALIRINLPKNPEPVLAIHREFFVHQQAAVASFLATRDERMLTRDPVVARFLPHLRLTRDLLLDPRMRQRLPPSLLPPLECIPDGARTHGFAVGAGGIHPVSGGTRRTFVSEPLSRTGMAMLRCRVWGQLGRGGASLLIEYRFGQLHSPMGEFGSAQLNGLAVTFVAPPGPVRIVATCPDGVENFRFTPPTELGWLSWVVPKVTAEWWLFGTLGLASLAAAVYARLRRSSPVRGGIDVARRHAPVGHGV